MQQSLKNLDQAFQNFFEKRGGDPQFKSKRARQRIRYPQPKLNWSAFDGRHLYLPKVGYRVDGHASSTGRRDEEWYRIENQERQILRQRSSEVAITEPIFAGGTVGIDLGLRDFVGLSSGEKIAPPQHYRKAQLKCRSLARQLSRKKQGSHNREKARLRLARLDERIANQRRDFHHKVSRQLVEENQFIGLEDLNVSGMMHHLAKSIGDGGLVSIHRDVGVQRRLVWLLPSGKSQPMVSIFEDLFCLWYGHALNSAARPPVAMPCLWCRP